MATVARSRRRPVPGGKTQPAARKTRWLVPSLAAAAAGLLIVLWFLPAIAVRSAMLATILNWSLALPVHLSIGGGSLGWLAPIELKEVSLHDAAGSPVCTIPSAASERSLAAILMQRRSPGTLLLKSPTLHVTLREDGSSVEDLLAVWQEGLTEKAAGELRLVVDDARVLVSEIGTDRAWEVQGLDVTFELPGDRDTSLRLDVAGSVLHDRRHTPFTFRWNGPERTANPQIARTALLPGSGEMHVDCVGLPLDLGRPLLRRLAPGWDLTGRIEGQLACQWQSGSSAASCTRLDAALQAESLYVSGPWLGRHPLRLASAGLSARLNQDGSHLVAETCRFSSDIGLVDCRGSCEIPTGSGAGGWVDSLAAASGILAGRIDLARLAAVFPHGIRLRDATEIVSGQANLSIERDATAEGRPVRGRIETTSLVARAGGREFAWERPLEVRWEGRDRGGRFVWETFSGRNDFLELSGSGTAEALRIHADYDMGKLVREVGRFVDLGGWEVSGSGRSQALLKRGSAGPWNVDAALEASDVRLARAGRPVWSEKRVELKTRIDVDRELTSLQIAELVINCQFGQLTAAGSVENVQGERQCRLSGRVDCDLETLTRWMGPQYADAVRLAGRRSHGFSFAGPLGSGGNLPAGELDWFQRTSGKVEFGWQQADLFGLRCGPAAAVAQWADGRVQVSPMRLDVNEGHVDLAPVVQLVPPPSELFLPAGPLAENVRVTPQMCQRGLMYIAPVLAGVTQAEGRVSIELDGMRIPLADPYQCDAAGRLVVHSIQVGPGPLVRELAQLLGHAAPAQLARESQIPFRIYQGKVYHENVGLEFPDVTVKTRGWVGFDQSISLLAEMPVPRRWIGGSSGPVAEAVKQQVIRIPIAGTLGEPRLDNREVERLSAEFLRQVGGDLLRDQLGRELERLLRPR